MPEFNIYRDCWERIVDCENWESYKSLVVETQSTTRGLRMRSGNTSGPMIGTMAIHRSCSLRRDCEPLLNLSTQNQAQNVVSSLRIKVMYSTISISSGGSKRTG